MPCARHFGARNQRVVPSTIDGAVQGGLVGDIGGSNASQSSFAIAAREAAADFDGAALVALSSGATPRFLTNASA